jgi:hypothetical protein
MGAARGGERRSRLGMGRDGRSWERVAATMSREGEGPRGRCRREGVCGGGGCVLEMNS